MTSVAVHTFVIEPIWNTESGVASTCVDVLSTPAAASMISPSFSTAIAAPGTLVLGDGRAKWAAMNGAMSSRVRIPSQYVVQCQDLCAIGQS